MMGTVRSVIGLNENWIFYKGVSDISVSEGASAR